MNTNPLAACAIALIFALAILPAPSAGLLPQSTCVPRGPGFIESEGEAIPVVRRLEVEYPPHWHGFDFAQGTRAEGAYSHGCVQASGSVGGIEAGSGMVGGLDNGFAWQADDDGDGIGDAWMAAWDLAVQLALDYDGDDLLLVDEFRWQRIPVCPDTEECLPPSLEGDAWLDGPEVHYWNNPSNDALNPGTGIAVFDPDRRIDTDGDLVSNVNDTDSDDDGLLDGEEYHTYGTYPEYPDSDCDAAATQCKPSRETRFFDAKPDVPGTGDLLDDAEELAYWNLIGGLTTDYDGDGIASNLLDADSDGDTLVDGEEVTQWHTKPYLLDSDLDGLQDGAEVRVHQTDPARWDTDGDGMPDGWEANHNLNPLADDAALDNDADGLSNLGEYAYARPGGWNEAMQGPWNGGTNPSDPDTEGDALFDGAEVLNHTTDPHHWDTDLDGMADFFEATHSFNPLDAGDASIDADADSFDQGNDGSIQKAWPNLDEYRYGRTAWDEVSLGPWRAGTDPLNLDTDGDGAGDGQEAFFGTDARVPADVLADDDQDGLTWAEEARLGLNPSDPDSDGDGLCDGSRGSNCRFPGMGSTGNMPGEVDYGSIPWETDSDSDGRSDSQEALAWDPGASGSAHDVDGDLLNGVIDSDSDADGLTDGDEFTRTTDMALPDTDHDRLKDGDEVQYYFTSPLDEDHDNDGLWDGDEVEAHHTRPKWWDTDGDGLTDGAEVNAHGTDPLLRDSDQDTLPDGWEVTRGTQARTPDADQDPDADGLSNAREYAIGSKPLAADSEGSSGDGLPDGYEDQYGLGVTVHNPSSDADLDGYTNLNEYTAKTHPLVADTDGDGRNDGWEALTAGTDPLDPDTDKDGLNDGPEYDAWTAKGYAWNTDHDGDTLKALRDPDSDNDGLSDRDELVDAQTKPHVPDSDGDKLSDFDEVVGFGGRFDPNDPDSDDDGQNDGVEASLLDPEGDTDHDGLKNGEEAAHGTDPTKEDTDCDGAWDRAELTYWQGAWNTGGNRLLNPDVDGDSLKDGVEIGTAGTPSQALYKTRPDVADTDGDGLRDDVEASNNVDACPAGGASMQAMSASPIPTALPTSGMKSMLDGLTRTSEGLYVGHDADGWYVQGGYGVQLYVNASLPATATVEDVVDALGLQRSAAAGGPAAGTNGQLTDPTLPDTDGDGLNDGRERSGSQNPYGQAPTDPVDCDSDDDGLGDGFELGVGSDSALASRPDTQPVCRQRDTDSGSKTNPKNRDTDGDLRDDGVEDRVESGAPNGAVDLTMDPWDYVPVEGETSPLDVDTDDDGISDLDEINGKNTINPSLSRGIPTLPFSFDSDRDGLSDGLELGVRNADKTSGTMSQTVTIFGHSLSTFQPYQGSGASVLVPYSGSGDSSTTRDFDADGVIDGLEDWNTDGIYYGTTGASAYDLNPNKADIDGDGLMDGRELRIYGSYNFPTIMQAWQTSGNQLIFDAGNPWETNSRNQHSESQSDDVPDGRDLNPKADAAITVGLAGFRTKEKSDSGAGHGGPWDVDLVMKFTVDLPVGRNTGDSTYKVETPTIVDLYAKNPTHVDLSNIQNKAVPAALWQAYGALNVLNFDIPDDIGTGVDLGNLNIRLAIHAYDEDWANNDDLDLNQNSGQTDILQTYLLDSESASEMPVDYTSWGNYVQHEGKGPHSAANGDVEASLSVRFGDSAPTYFITGLRQIRATGMALPPTGTCLGMASCV